jgi:two-component system NtrC family sensor kinase
MRTSGLRLQLLLLLGGLLVLTFVPLHLALATYTQLTLHQTDEAHARALGQSLDLYVREAGGRVPAGKLLDQLQSLAPDAGLVAARVSRQGAEPVQFGPLPILLAFAPGGEKTEFHFARLGERRRLVGRLERGPDTVWLAIDAERSGARAATLIRAFGLYSFLMAVSLLTIAYFALTRLIVRPLDLLSEAAQSVTLGARQLAVPESRVRELSELGASLERMTKRLLSDEESLRREILEVQRAKLELQKAQSQLVRSERLASVGRLAAGLAHEIGNPIAAVMGLLDLLLDGDLEPAEQRDFIKRMRAETERIHRTLRDLLEFARPAQPARGEAPTPGDVEAAIHDTASLVVHQPSMQKLELCIDVFPGLPRVTLANEQLVQVLLNLILNAADALQGREGGRVSVVARGSEGSVRVEVEDNGDGVPADIAEHIFEPFFTTKEVGKGTGLGLSVCQGLVAAAGGSLTLDPTPTRGACFIVQLPVAEPR